MADQPAVLYETKENGRIAIMTINRPERMNSLGFDVREGLNAGWERFAADDNAWVMILTGSGKAFCAGADLKQTADIRTGKIQPRESHTSVAYPLSESMELWKPIIAAINGFCIAGGFNLAMQCDIRLAAQSAEIGIAEARWNMPAGWLHDLSRQMHLQHALELAMWADRRITAQRAYEIGWVNKVLPDDKLMEEAMEWAERILYLAPRALRNFKQILYRGWSMDMMNGRAFARALEQNLVGMADSIEGPQAFAQKRKPTFQNR